MDEIPEVEPFTPFARWFEEAGKSERDPEAMTLATATPEGRPSMRMVLLKGADERGFVFYTNFESRKAGELLANPFAAICLYWKSLRRQIRVEGRVEQVTEDEADAYFASRARDSQIGAWASEQSRPLSNRELLEKRVELFTTRFADKPVVPRPANWSGFRIRPDRVEFWHERPFRLHDRLVFVREGEGWPATWRRERLFP